MTSDLVVVGAGVAGWTAATRSSELGLRVTVLERAADAPSGGNGALSGGVFHASYLRPDHPPARLEATLLAKVDGCARPDVVSAWAGNIRRARDYLGAHGATFFSIAGRASLLTV